MTPRLRKANTRVFSHGQKKNVESTQGRRKRRQAVCHGYELTLPEMGRNKKETTTDADAADAERLLKYAMPLEKGKIQMLRAIRESEEIGSSEFETFLKGCVECHLEEKLKWGELQGDMLFERVVDIVGDDSWMRFVRLHLRMKDEHISEFKRKHCTNADMYSLIRVYTDFP